MIRTSLVDNLFVKFTEENRCSVENYWRKENALHLYGSTGQPEEVAEVVYFLASDAPHFCTCFHYLVDDGLLFPTFRNIPLVLMEPDDIHAELIISVVF